MEIGWIELQRLLQKVESSTNANVIHVKRQHLRDDKRLYDFSVTTHRRYSDKSILTASVAEDVNVKR